MRFDYQKITKILLYIILIVVLYPVHSLTLNYPMLETITLPKPHTDSNFSIERAIQERRSVREFSKAPLSLNDVSQLLWSAQGITNDEGFRAAPSAGALYPLELYLVVGNVEGLKPGIYHYSATSHQLHLTVLGDIRPKIAKAALGQSWVKQSAAVLVFAANERRTTRKYGHRGIRYIHIEVGHSAQNVFLQAESLGVVAAVVGAFDDDRVAELLMLPQQEQALYLMPLGRR